MERDVHNDLQETLFKGFAEPTGAVFPIMPQWCLSVDGRKFGNYLQLAKKKPRRSLLYIPIMDPLSKAATLWGYVAMTTDMTYTAFLVPLSLAFNDYLQLQAYNIFDLIGSCVYILDLFLEFHIGFLVKWERETVTITDGWQVAKYYVTKSTFWIDLLAVLPIIGQIILTAVGTKNSQLVQLILVLKLLRLLRVLKMLKSMGKMDQSGGFLFAIAASRLSAMKIFMLHAAISMCILINLLACLWWWLAVVEGLENSWVAYLDKPQVDLTTANDSTRWLFSAYYVLCTIATVGYGDITPQTTLEVAFSFVYIICGVAYFGYLITTISAVMQSNSHANAEGGAYIDKLQRIEDWMHRNGFPKALCCDIRKYYATAWAPTYAGDETYFSDLPSWLRIKASKTLLEHSPSLFALVGEDTVLTDFERTTLVRLIGSSAIPQRFPSGHSMYSSGDAVRYMYFLDEGELAALLPGQSDPSRMSAPAVLGIGALFAQYVEVCRSRAGSAITITNCMVWRIDCEVLCQGLAFVAPAVLLAILKQYKKRVQEVCDRIATSKLSEESRQRVNSIYGAIVEGLQGFEVKLTQMVEDSLAAGGTMAPAAQGEESLPIEGSEENYIHPFGQNGADEEAAGDMGQTFKFKVNMNRRQVDLSAQEDSGEGDASSLKAHATENGVNYLC